MAWGTSRSQRSFFSLLVRQQRDPPAAFHSFSQVYPGPLILTTMLFSLGFVHENFPNFLVWYAIAPVRFLALRLSAAFSLERDPLWASLSGTFSFPPTIDEKDLVRLNSVAVFWSSRQFDFP